jgi:hypothetical protein
LEWQNPKKLVEAAEKEEKVFTHLWPSSDFGWMIVRKENDRPEVSLTFDVH